MQARRALEGPAIVLCLEQLLSCTPEIRACACIRRTCRGLWTLQTGGAVRRKNCECSVLWACCEQTSVKCTESCLVALQREQLLMRAQKHARCTGERLDGGAAATRSRELPTHSAACGCDQRDHSHPGASCRATAAAGLHN